jgi:hypothetical protein
MLGTSLAANLMKGQADDIKLLLVAQLDDNHSTRQFGRPDQLSD